MENQDPAEHPIHDVEDQPNESKFVVGKDGLPVALPDEGHAGKEEHPEKIEGMRTESSGSDNEDEAEPSELDEKKQVGFMGTVMNLLNSLLGAGILSVPNCFCDTGTGASTIIIVVIAFLSYLATYMVVVTSCFISYMNIFSLIFSLI